MEQSPENLCRRVSLSESFLKAGDDKMNLWDILAEMEMMPQNRASFNKVMLSPIVLLTLFVPPIVWHVLYVFDPDLVDPEGVIVDLYGNETVAPVIMGTFASGSSLYMFVLLSLWWLTIPAKDTCLGRRANWLVEALRKTQQEAEAEISKEGRAHWKTLDDGWMWMTSLWILLSWWLSIGAHGVTFSNLGSLPWFMIYTVFALPFNFNLAYNTSSCFYNHVLHTLCMDQVTSLIAEIEKFTNFGKVQSNSSQNPVLETKQFDNENGAQNLVSESKQVDDNHFHLLCEQYRCARLFVVKVWMAGTMPTMLEFAAMLAMQFPLIVSFLGAVNHGNFGMVVPIFLFVLIIGLGMFLKLVYMAEISTAVMSSDPLKRSVTNAALSCLSHRNTLSTRQHTDLMSLLTLLRESPCGARMIVRIDMPFILKLAGPALALGSSAITYALSKL